MQAGYEKLPDFGTGLDLALPFLRKVRGVSIGVTIATYVGPQSHVFITRMHLHSVTKEFPVGHRSGNFEIKGETISAVLDAAGGGDSDDVLRSLICQTAHP